MALPFEHMTARESPGQGHGARVIVRARSHRAGSRRGEAQKAPRAQIGANDLGFGGEDGHSGGATRVSLGTERFHLGELPVHVEEALAQRGLEVVHLGNPTRIVSGAAAGAAGQRL